jgi:hypothetical protein
LISYAAAPLITPGRCFDHPLCTAERSSCCAADQVTPLRRLIWPRRCALDQAALLIRSTRSAPLDPVTPAPLDQATPAPLDQVTPLCR